MPEYIVFITGGNYNKNQSVIKTRKKKNCFLPGEFFSYEKLFRKALVMNASAGRLEIL